MFSTHQMLNTVRYGDILNWHSENVKFNLSSHVKEVTSNKLICPSDPQIMSSVNDKTSSLNF